LRITLIAALMAGTLATPAFAQDEPGATITPAPPSMTGFRIEGLVGWDHTEILDDDDGGILYGVGVGYDFQAGRAILSIEAEANDSTNNGCITGLANANDRLCVTSGRDLYIGGRVGFMVGRNVLLFGKAGYTNARYITEYDDATAGIHDRFGQNLDGIRVGAGAQFGVGRNAYIRTEARYSNYEGGGDRGALLAAFGFRF
jgi:outer membrane immunogenic protein